MIATGRSAAPFRMTGRATPSEQRAQARGAVTTRRSTACVAEQMQVDVFERRHFRPHLEHVGARRSTSARTSAGVSRSGRPPASARSTRAESTAARRSTRARRRAAPPASPARRTIDASGRQAAAQGGRPIEREQAAAAAPATRSASRSASSRLCVETRIAHPAARRSSSSCRTLRVISGSRPDVGSSSSSTIGSWISARASATFCRVPFGQLRRCGSSARSRKPNESSARSTSSAARAVRTAGVNAQVFADRQAIPQPGRFGEKSDARAQRAAGGAASADAVDATLPLVGAISPASIRMRRRLARAVRAEQRDDFRALDIQRDASTTGGRRTLA